MLSRDCRRILQAICAATRDQLCSRVSRSGTATDCAAAAGGHRRTSHDIDMRVRAFPASLD
jgi:hypothetical protein